MELLKLINMSLTLKLLSITFLSIISIVCAQKTPQTVTYDGRSLLIDGKRELFFSGSVHYPRSTPDVCYFFLK